MTSYQKDCDCIVCGEPKAHLGYYSCEDGRPVYVCENCGSFFKLYGKEVLEPLDALDEMPTIQNFSNY
ncbi:MAG: hypothetical protein ACI4AM_01165 [Muribaculaceae bacterium]